ncbi:MAG TPA: 30S ribosomal protein S6 [bacterium]
MRKYETVIILSPSLSEVEQTAIIERATQALKDKGANSEKFDIWGKRTLAFPINKSSEGIYVRAEFTGEREAVNELERILRVSENVFRFMTTKIQEDKKQEAEVKT